MVIPDFLAATSLFQPPGPHIYKYHVAVRWTGLWVNPNTHSLLMRVGLTPAFCHLKRQLDPRFDGDRDWRRPLWEYFYPRIRRQTDVATGAQTILQKLQSRIKLRPEGPSSIRQVWRSRSANKSGFEALCVAAWRSVGIPVPRNARGRAEYHVGSEWRVAPHAATQ